MAMSSQAISATDDNGGAAFERLLETVRAQRAQFSRDQQISAEVVELIRDAGFYRAMVARRFGGEQVSPTTFLNMVERLSEVDGSAGWVASFGFSAVYLSALPIATLEQIYADGPDVIFAGGIYPPQKALPVDGGLEVSGRWSWGSGSTGADIIGVGIKVEGGESNGLPLIAVMPAAKAKIDRNWDVIGLKGTGSHDIVVDRVVVPPEWTFIRGGRSSLDDPLYQYPTMALAAQVLAVVALGTARGALDILIDLAGGRSSITGAANLADRPYFQTDIAKAEALLRSARAFFYDITEESYATLLAGGELSVEQRALLRLASTNAARAGADVAQAVYRLSGTTGIASDHMLARHMQDAMVVPQHAFLSDGTWQNAGRVLLHLDSPPGFP
ncbi:MAG: flavin-dependent monooxygenase [Reyranella sp.]|jgi:alkylation response protein AidB-like acyl-CoA dehydrogenase|uniref:acyl-CoA dehydrogenase family protein n=1 Tax=Reyranella sp. TaxID=1929291 RepID=UPI0012187028|nr:acyl-CoA dehydrogenase family protein [Reyranella sp.]TAJ40606.1 MAG: flavin-dependent monooxygenase [Reyranella sp.]